MFPKPISRLGIEKLTLTQQKHTFANQKQCITTQDKQKKLKPGLVASYDIRPGNRDTLFWFWHFINLSLTYLGTYPSTYSPGTHTWLRKHKNSSGDKIVNVNFFTTTSYT